MNGFRSALLLLGLLFGQEGDPAERQVRELTALAEELGRLKGVEDAEIFSKGVAWALRYESKPTDADRALIQKALQRGHARAQALAAGAAPWAEKKGRLVRGYRSAVDGSVQPFGLVIPADYTPAKPSRLDVILHGSSKPAGMSELRFMSRFDEGDLAGKAPEADFIELHPLGRVENCYRWAGETDVFEAIEAVCRMYAVDRSRIVLRGMSMGASGTWHLGLKHPDYFAALGPYCGYVDTHQFSETPGMNFVKVGPLPPHQERMLHMLDSVDYAANAGVVPAVACIGEKDPFFQAHVIMGGAMEREGLTMVNLISPGTGHTIDPVTQKEQLRRIAEHVSAGRPEAPEHLRFVTWTLKYSRCFWLQALALDRHYERAELEARVSPDGSVEMKEPKNIASFAIHPPVLQQIGAHLRIGGVEISLPARKTEDAPRVLTVGRLGEKWEILEKPKPPQGKRPGLQGPIDDAFTTPFLCVRGTGQPWHPAIGAWSEATLQRFEYEWKRYFRGRLAVKLDTQVTEEDLQRCNLILFGDPASNSWIARVLPQLPIRWTKDELWVGREAYAAATHAPALICPNPLAGAAGRYVVLNSGHTFHEKELALLNYLLFPRLGDWAVFKVGGKLPSTPSDPLDEELLQAGLFNEAWSFPADK